MKVVQNVKTISENIISVCQHVSMSICQNATFQLRYQNESCSECHHDVILKREGGTCDKIIINSTQKVSSRVLKSRNMMSVARTSYFSLCNYGTLSPAYANKGNNYQ